MIATANDCSCECCRPELWTVGARVRVVNDISRRSRIKEIRTNVTGLTLYVLEDGGWMSGRELELDSLGSKPRRCA